MTGSTGPAGGERLGDTWAEPGHRPQPGVASEAVVGELVAIGVHRLEVRVELGQGEPDLDVALLELDLDRNCSASVARLVVRK